MTNYPYQQYNYGRTNYAMPNYMQPQYAMQPQMQMAQPQPQMQQQTPIDIPLQNTVYATLKEAEGYIMYPNTKILFIDKEKGMSYLKIANNDGQSFMRYFKHEEVQADGTPLKPTKQAEAVDYSAFVKKSDLGGFVGLDEYNKLLAKVEQLQKQIMGVKPNGGNKQ